MKKAAIYICLLSTFVLIAEERVLEPKDVISLLMEHNNSIKIAEESKNLSRTIYTQIISAGEPQVSFVTDSFSNPLYGYGRSINGVGDSLEYHKVSGGIALNQRLSTGGSGQLTLNHVATFTSSSARDTWEITQVPTLGLSIFQPVMGGGEFLDFTIEEKICRKSEIVYNLSAINELETKNQIVLGVFSAIHSLNVLRASVDILEQQVALSNVKIDMALENRRRGVISTSELLEIEVNAGREKELLFDFNYQIRQIELNLEGVLGVEDIDNYSFLMDMTSIDYSYSGVEGQSPGVERAKLGLEDKMLEKQIDNFNNSPILSLSVSGFPRYPTDRGDIDRFSSSITDYFEDGSDFNVNFGLSINWDIYDGHLKRLKSKADDISIEIANKRVYEATLTDREHRGELMEKLELLSNKITLINSSIDYDKIILEREIDLLKVGLSTQLDVDLLKLEVLSRKSDVKALYGEYQLTIFQLISLDGSSIEAYVMDL